MTAGPDVPLLGAAEIRALAARLGIRPTKQWGQNFVVDANTVRRIVRVAGVGADDTVVEVGPGLGSLTLALLPGRRPGGRRRGRPGARRRAARDRGAARARRWPTGSRWCSPTPSPCASCPARRRPPSSPTCPTTSRCRSCCASSSSSRACARPGHGAARGRRAARGAARARAPTACRASRRPGTPTCASRARCRAACSGRCPTSTPGWSMLTRREPPATDGDPRRRCSRASTRRSPSAARPCGRRWPAGPARRRRRGGAGRGRRRPPHPRGAARRRGVRGDRRRPHGIPRASAT